MMEKSSPKLPVRKEKIQSSCIMGLADMFDFRTGRSNQKLLSNGRPMCKNVSDVKHGRKINTPANFGQWQGIEGEADLEMHDGDTSETNVMNLMREEFATPKQMKKQKKSSKQQHKSSVVGFVEQSQNNCKKVSKTSEKADLVPMEHLKDRFLLGNQQSSCSSEISLDKQNLAAMLEEICSQTLQDRRLSGDIQKDIILSKHNQLDQVNVQLLQMSAKAFIDQIYINGKHQRKDGTSSKCKQFSDASETLNLNMDLFLKLMQDPNSLLVKNIKNLQFAQRVKERMKLFLDSKSSECGGSGTRNDQNPVCTTSIQKKNTNNLLWNKLVYRHGYSSKGNTSSGASNKIVVLKPESKRKENTEVVSCHCSSLQSHQSFKNKGQNCKSTYFFKDIKRKFKKAVGESQQKHNLISLDENLKRVARYKHSSKNVDKGITPGITVAKSALSSHAKRREKQRKPVDLTSSSGPQIASFSETIRKKLDSSTISCSKQHQLDIFMEGKRHLSERFRNVSVGEIQPRKEASRTLQMILSSPDRNFLVTHSLKGHRNASDSAKMRFSPCSNIQITAESSLQIDEGKRMDFPSPLEQTEDISSSPDFRRADDQLENSEFRPNFLDNVTAETGVLERICSINDDLKPRDCANIQEANEVTLLDNSNILEEPYEPNRLNDSSSRQGTETINWSDGEGYMESSILTISSENRPLRSLLDPSRPLNICKLEIMDSSKYKEEHRSPVSVLEPFSPEDINSPTSIVSNPAESPLQPHHIDFDDYSDVESLKNPKTNAGASMDGEESLYMFVKAVMQASGLNFDALSLKGPLSHVPHIDMVDGVELESYCDLQLLFDCSHEVLLDVFEYYFGHAPWVSFLEPKIRPFPKEENVIDEVVKEVNLYLLPKDEQPTLDQLIRNDMRKFGSWLDIRPDTEDILIQIAEDILQDSLSGTILEVHI